jgi:hypothetical protein
MANTTYIRPQQKEGETGKLDKHWRSLFLDALAETSNVSEAARIAGINPSRAYKVRRFEPAFRQAWYAALLEGYEHLELETLHRLRMGTAKDEAKFDASNALRLLMLHKDTVARERALRDAEDEDSVLATLSAKINAMRLREAEVRQMQAEPVGATHGDG